jgi:hypothetical protein
MLLQQYDLLVCYHENIPKQKACLNNRNLCATISLLAVLHFTGRPMLRLLRVSHIIWFLIDAVSIEITKRR